MEEFKIVSTPTRTPSLNNLITHVANRLSQNIIPDADYCYYKNNGITIDMTWNCVGISFSFLCCDWINVIDYKVKTNTFINDMEINDTNHTLCMSLPLVDIYENINSIPSIFQEDNRLLDHLADIGIDYTKICKTNKSFMSNIRRLILPKIKNINGNMLPKDLVGDIVKYF